MTTSVMTDRVRIVISAVLLLLLFVPHSRAMEETSPKRFVVGQEVAIIDPGGDPRVVRVDAVEIDPFDLQRETPLYSVSVLDSAGKRASDLCQQDRDGQAKAIALRGHWDRRGRHIASERVTFACTRGVLAKCARWGYKPWHASQRALHQACTRMARADYCGDGRSHTLDGTAVNFFDLSGVKPRAPVAGMAFEAAWGPDGALALSRGRFTDAKTIIAECPERLQLIEPSLTKSATPEALSRLSPRALLFNESYP